MWNLIPYHGIRRGKNHLGWKPWLLFHLHHENPKGPLVNWHVASRWHIPIFNRKCIDSIRVFDPGYRKSHRYQLIQAKVYSMATCSIQTLVKEVMFFFSFSPAVDHLITRHTPGIPLVQIRIWIPKSYHSLSGNSSIPHSHVWYRYIAVPSRPSWGLLHFESSNFKVGEEKKFPTKKRGNM